MRWFLIAMLAVPAVVIADVYVAIPADTSQALYFPSVENVLCYSVAAGGKPTAVRTDRCWPLLVTTVVVEGSLLVMNQPLERLLESCAWLNCELRAMPD